MELVDSQFPIYVIIRPSSSHEMGVPSCCVGYDGKGDLVCGAFWEGHSSRCCMVIQVALLDFVILLLHFIHYVLLLFF